MTHLAVVETGLPFGAVDGSPRPVQGQEKSETSTVLFICP